MDACVKDVYTTGQIAKICGCAPRTVSKWIDRGKLNGFKLPMSDDRRVGRGDLIRFLRDNNYPQECLTAIGVHEPSSRPAA